MCTFYERKRNNLSLTLDFYVLYIIIRIYIKNIKYTNSLLGIDISGKYIFFNFWEGYVGLTADTLWDCKNIMGPVHCGD